MEMPSTTASSRVVSNLHMLQTRIQKGAILLEIDRLGQDYGDCHILHALFVLCYRCIGCDTSDHQYQEEFTSCSQDFIRNTE